MTTGELLRMLIVDALVIVGFLAGAFFLYHALFVVSGQTQIAFSVGAIACSVIPLPIAVAMHNQIVRRRLKSGEE